MKKPRKATPSSVSRLLGTRFERSASYSSCIRGWKNRSHGFVVKGCRDGKIRVDYEMGSCCRTERDERARLYRLGLYFRLLSEHYTVEIEHWPTGHISALVVREKVS